MKRRLVIAGLACWPAARLLAQEPQPEPLPHRRISAAELYDALSARFPMRLGIPGVLELQVSAPQLLLLPERNKLGATLVAHASGSTVQPTPPGRVDVVFGLRYASSDRTVRAQQMEVLDLQLPGVTADTTQTLRALLPEIFREALGEVVLHQFTARELALPDAMGFEPAQFTVTDDGLVVGFVPQARR